MSDTKYILALVQGTTCSRAIIHNQSGEIVSQAQQQFKQHSPKPGWVEYDAMEIWSSQVDTMEQALAAKNLRAPDIATISITQQQVASVLWDRATGLPVYNAIAKQDQRTTTYCSQLKDLGLETMIRQKTGQHISSNSTGTKLRWLLQNIKGLRERAEYGELCFGTLDSWLIWNLTSGQVHATAVSNANHTLLYHLNDKKWDEDLLRLFDIPQAVLPAVSANSDAYGNVANGRTLAGVPIVDADDC